MSALQKYQMLEIPGSFLIPSFSIYLFVITTSKEVLYYLGMTGDNYYPSARSAIHRLSGHFDKTKESTQNQLCQAIIDREIDIYNANITMHNWMIEGFESWGKSLKAFSTRELRGSDVENYQKYKERQRQVLQLEQFLINRILEKVNVRCLNKAVIAKQIGFENEFFDIINKVDTIVK